MRIRHFLIITALLFVSPCNNLLEARQQNIPDPEVSQIFRNIAEITDPASIQIILDDFLLPENVDEIERLEVIDVSNIGFGSNDVLVVYPSQNVYLIDQPTPQLAEIMRGWSIQEQRRDAENLGSQYFYPAHADTLERWEIDESEIELVQNSLISDLLLSLERNYNDMPISLRFERDYETFTFQMWNYNEDAFEFSPRPPGVADSIAVNDFLYVLYSDSTVIADTTMYDVIYINKTVEETIYLPPISQEPVIQIETLPGAHAFDLNQNSAVRRE